MTQKSMQSIQKQVGEQNGFRTSLHEAALVSTKAPIDDGFTLATNKCTKMKARVETYQHQPTKVSTTNVDCTKSTHERMECIEHKLDHNKWIEEQPPKEDATKNIHDGTSPEPRGKK